MTDAVTGPVTPTAPSPAAPWRSRSGLEDAQPRRVEAELRRLSLLCESGSSLGDAARYMLFPSGKLLRPMLLLHCAGAVGGEVQQVLPAAAGLECAHAGSLIHDDLIDQDAVRRGRAAVHTRFGPGTAIVTGNALFFAWFEGLAECAARGVPHDRITAVMRIQARAGRLACDGVTRELNQAGALGTTVEEYLEMIRLKTAVLIEAACRIGATLAGAQGADVEGLAAYGEALGMAFQIRDDLLPYRAAPAIAGKPGESDLRNLRPTLPVLLALQLGTATQRTALRRAFASPPGTCEEEIRALVAATGAPAQVNALADSRLAQALDHLSALPDSPHRRCLSAWGSAGTA